MKQLEDVLSQAILQKCISHEKLCGIPYAEVLEAITTASAEEIAVLGVELFQVGSGVLHFLTMSGYEFPNVGEWDEFVQANNTAARAFVMNNPRSEGFVYILTSACREEYQNIVASRDDR